MKAQRTPDFQEFSSHPPIPSNSQPRRERHNDMNADVLQSADWYWVRRPDGSVAPYRFHRVRRDNVDGPELAEFFVGSMVQAFPLSAVVAKALMPVR